MIHSLLFCLIWLPMSDRALERALEANDPGKVERALDRGANPNVRFDKEESALQYAIRECHPSIAKALLSAGADGALKDANGRNALHSAATMGRLAMVRRLASRNVPADEPDNEGVTPLALAVWRGDWPMVRWLIRKGADVNRVFGGQTLLAQAILRGKLGIALTLVEAGARYDSSDGALSGKQVAEWMRQRDFSGAVRGQYSLTEIGALVEALDRQDRAGINAMLPEIDYQEPDPFGPLPLYLAALFDDTDTLAGMWENGAVTQHANAIGSPPLIAAVMLGRLEAAERILDGLKINPECWLFSSHPLDGAIFQLDKPMAELLIAAGFKNTSPGIRKIEKIQEILPLTKARKNLVGKAKLGVFIDFGRILKHPDTRFAPIIDGTMPDDERDFDQRADVDSRLPAMVVDELGASGIRLMLSQLTLGGDGKVYNLQPLFLSDFDNKLLERIVRAYVGGLRFKPARQDGVETDYRDLHVLQIRSSRNP